MNSPLVTVIMPAYERPEFIRGAIESVMAQSLPDFELLIADDSRGEAVAEVVASFDDQRIRYHRNPERIGFIRNFNTAIGLSRGRFIVALPDDDLILPRFLEVLVSALTSNPGCAMAGVNLKTMDLFGRITRERLLEIDSRVFAPRELTRAGLETNAAIRIPGVFAVDRAYLARHEILYREHVIGPDILFSYDINRESGVVFVDEALYVHRFHSAQDSAVWRHLDQVRYHEVVREIAIEQGLESAVAFVEWHAGLWMTRLLLEHAGEPAGAAAAREDLRTSTVWPRGHVRARLAVTEMLLGLEIDRSREPLREARESLPPELLRAVEPFWSWHDALTQGAGFAKLLKTSGPVAIFGAAVAGQLLALDLMRQQGLLLCFLQTSAGGDETGPFGWPLFSLDRCPPSVRTVVVSQERENDTRLIPQIQSRIPHAAVVGWRDLCAGLQPAATRDLDGRTTRASDESGCLWEAAGPRLVSTSTPSQWE
jgi:glycosyltransferase involved in cell wall biosynthesis